MACDFIVAETLLHADDTALKNGWTRIKHDLWKTQSGADVRYCYLSTDITGPRPRTIYLGFGWFRNQAAQEAVNLASCLQWKVKQLKWSPLKGEKE